MDIATLGGIGAALAAVIVANLLGGGNPLQLVSSAVPPLLCVFGSFAASMAQYPLSVTTGLPKLFAKAFFKGHENMSESVEALVKMADKARREGILSLEEDAKKIEDEFLRKGVMLVVDGVDAAQVRRILEMDVHNMHERHLHGIGYMNGAGGFSPTMGIIGTVMELIVLMQHLDEPEHLGHGIANAFLVTLWGLAAANLIFLPIGGKLKANSEEEVVFRNMLIEGILSLQAGENPRIVREKLSTFLPPKARVGEAGEGKAAGATA
ncbi:MAG: motility protein A [Chloroflexi bacterium]|nr:motility protein A [Chloroflexota bacterium]